MNAQIKTRYTKSFSLLLVAVAYTISYAVAATVVVYSADTDWHPLYRLALAHAAATLVVYLFSLGFKNSSFYDAFWSAAPPFFLLFLVPLSVQGNDLFRILLISSVLLLWAIRLTYNWARHWTGIKMEDWRYVELKKDGGLKAFFADFLGIHFFPTAMVFALCLPLYPAIVEPVSEITVLDIFAFALALTGIAIETIADEQLRIFKKRIKSPGEFMRSGLWSLSRHPNYFGEWLFWTGIFMFGLVSNQAFWWTGIGSLSLLMLFLFISIPMMDKRVVENRPDYKAHMKKVSGFFPIPFKRK